MYSPSLFVCRQRTETVELVRPLVDLRLELVEAHARRRLRRVAAGEHVEVHAVEDEDLHRRPAAVDVYAISRSSSRRTSSGSRGSTNGPPSPSRTRLISAAGALLVAQQRLPRALAVDPHRLRRRARARPAPCRGRTGAARRAGRARPPRRAGRSKSAAASSAWRRCGRGSASAAARGRADRAGRSPPCTRPRRARRASRPGEQPRLHELGHALAPLALGQRLEQRLVDDDARRPVERADEVLALGHVDRRLAADRRVDLADERRRHGDPRHAAQVGRRREARDVGRAAAAERDERAAAVEPQLAPEPRAGSRLPSPPRPTAARASWRAGRRAPAARAARRCPSRARRRRAPPARRPARARRAGRASPARGGRRRRRAPRRRRRSTTASATSRYSGCRSSYRRGTAPRPARADGSSGGRAIHAVAQVDVAQHRERAAQRLADLGRGDGAAAERDHAAAPGRASATRTACASSSRKPSSPRSSNSSRDRLRRALLDRLVEVEERAVEPRRRARGRSSSCPRP